MITCKTTAKNQWLVILFPVNLGASVNIMTIFNRNYFIAVDFYSNFQELDTLQNNPTTANVIWCCKSNLSQHGIPDVALLPLPNNLIVKSLSNLQNNGSLNAVHQIHSQSNGKATSAVKIAKKLITKIE